MKKLCIALLGLLAMACGATLSGGPITPVTFPRPVAIRTCVAGATIRIDGALLDGYPPATADASGDYTFPAIPGSVVAFKLHLTAPGRDEYGAVVSLRPGAQQVLVGSCVPLTDAVLQVQAPAWASRFTDAGERGTVRVEGVRFAREDGSTYQWRGTDGFLLYLHWLAEREGIDATVENWLACGGRCDGPGPNVIRVLGMVKTFAHLWPQEHADYYDQLRPFADHLWATFHVRLEFVVFADAQDIMPDRADEARHADRVVGILASAPNVFIEMANEPFKNIPGGGQAAYELGRQVQARGPPVASGDYNYDLPPLAIPLDYVTVHNERSADWPRKAKDLDDYRNLTHTPVVGDEPMGFAEAPSGSRSTSADDAAYFAATCGLFASGCTFHSDAGIAYGQLGPLQAEASRAFFQALAWVPVEAQFAPYMRGGDPCNGSGDVGEIGLQHFDDCNPAGSLRTFCKQVGADQYCVAVRPGPAWRAAGKNGYRVVAEPRRGLARVTR